jgi:hypothetical protein
MTIPMIPPTPREVPLEPSLRFESSIEEFEAAVVREKPVVKLSSGRGTDSEECENPRGTRTRKRIVLESMLIGSQVVLFLVILFCSVCFLVV